jgi:PDZ domain
MLKIASFVLAGLVAGLAIATWWGGESRAPARATDDGIALDERLAALEAALDAERERRFELEDQVAALAERLVAVAPVVEDLTAADESAFPRTSDGEADQEPLEDVVPLPLRDGVGLAFGRGARFGSDEELVERFVAAGISADRAQWILRRTEELRMQALQAQYDAARGVTDTTPISPRSNVLREELGDADYGRYLEALGRPTSVFVGDVLARSPAEQAGLQAGDQVVAYAGGRVFDMGDLNRLVLEGEPGQMVAVDVVRDGQTVQLYLPRGPIGIAAGRGGRRVR